MEVKKLARLDDENLEEVNGGLIIMDTVYRDGQTPANAGYAVMGNDVDADAVTLELQQGKSPAVHSGGGQAKNMSKKNNTVKTIRRNDLGSGTWA